MRRLKTVIHIHTNHSYDSNVRPTELVATARAQGVDCIAVTDHDTITGALEAQRIGGVRVIVGQEISSADGHVIGLFLPEPIPPGLPIEQTASLIRSLGGLILAPHPFTILCSDSLGPAMDRLLPWLDAVEICNAQDPLPWENRRARQFAERHGITPYVGADTHLKGHLAAAYQVLPDFGGPVEFLDSLRRAELCPGRFAFSYFAVMGLRHLWQKLSRRPVGGFGAHAPKRCLTGTAH